MEKFFRVTAIGDLATREWKPDNGETRNIASAEVTLSDGLDTLVAEANDDMARNLVTKTSSTGMAFTAYASR